MNEQETIRAAMSIIGSRKSHRKAEAARENSKRSPVNKKGRVMSEATKQKMRDAQTARRERENSLKIPLETP